jgi:alkaline phosphatase
VYRQTASRKKVFLSILLFLSLWLIAASFTPKKQYRAKKGPEPKAKNIIFMVADGMGLAQ